MNILFLTSQIPHARSRGGQQIIYQRMTRLAARGHTISLAAFAQPGEESLADDLRARIQAIDLIPTPLAPSWYRHLRDYALASTPPPFWPQRSEEMSLAAGRRVEASGVEVVVAEFAAMGQYLYRNRHMPAVRKALSLHHCASISPRTKRVAEERTLIRTLRDQVRERNLYGYEFGLYRAMDRVLVLTLDDRLTLESYAPDLRVAVTPPGVDLDYFRPADEPRAEDIILFTGMHADEPNRDAVRWFLTQTWPLLKKRHPKLIFQIIGPGAPAEMKELVKRHEGVDLIGEVDDVRPFMDRAKLFICPVRMGSGLRVKVLEAMAAGLPVVTTTIAAEGIPAQSGMNCVLADDPGLMAESVDWLLNDPEWAADLAARARTLVSERFTWERGIRIFEETLQSLLPDSISSPV